MDAVSKIRRWPTDRSAGKPKTSAKPRPQPPLDQVEDILTGMVGSILQVSDRKARVALGAGVNVAAGAAVVGAGTGLVATFGSASTGTAIASLFGAAKSTATLYWIGGLVGGGVAAGGVIVAVGGAGAGFYAARRMRGAVFGKARAQEGIPQEEQRILTAIAILKSAIGKAAAEDREITPREMALFAKFGTEPLIAEIEEALDKGVFDKLTRYNRIRLRGHLHTLRHARKRMESHS